MTLIEIVHCLQSTSGAKAKDAIMREHRDNSNWTEFLTMVYSPDVNFGIRKVQPTETGNESLDALLADFRLISTFTGNEQVDYTTSLANKLDKDNQQLLNLALSRNLRIGISVTSINKAYGREIIFDATKHYMRCSTENAKFNYANAIVQEKLDGAYIEWHLDKNLLRTRNGSIIKSSVHGMPAPNASGILMGEILFIDDESNVLSREDSNGKLNSMLSKNTHAPFKLVIWDYRADDSIEYKVAYSERLTITQNIINTLTNDNVELVESHTVSSREEALSIACDFIAQGKEGAVVKESTMFWKAGTSKQQLKLKVEAECDLVVVGFNDGDEHGRHKDTFGSIACESACGKLKVNVSGLSDQQRKTINEHRDDWIGKVVAVTYNQIIQTNDNQYSLFLPRLSKNDDSTISWRDKASGDTLLEIQQAYDNLIK